MALVAVGDREVSHFLMPPDIDRWCVCGGGSKMSGVCAAGYRAGGNDTVQLQYINTVQYTISSPRYRCTVQYIHLCRYSTQAIVLAVCVQHLHFDIVGDL